MTNVIEVKNLVKKYHKAEKNAVDGVSFDVKEGEFFALLGPNGAGKTTTISILTTTLSKTSGEIFVAGHDIEKNSSDVRKRVGIIFQNPSLDLNLTAEENIRMHAVLYGIYPFKITFGAMDEEYKKRVYELTERLGLDRKEIFKQIKTFSGGMKRKLEIIRSLMHRPEVLFLDEPTVGLDPASRNSLWEYLREVRIKEKTTIFLTTHYLDEAEDADTVCIINKGKVVSLDTPENTKKRLTEEYIVMDASERLKLQMEFEQKGLHFEDMGERYHVFLDGRDAQEIIKMIDTKLSVLEIHQPTLEDAYLSIVEEKK